MLPTMATQHPVSGCLLAWTRIWINKEWCYVLVIYTSIQTCSQIISLILIDTANYSYTQHALWWITLEQCYGNWQTEHNNVRTKFGIVLVEHFIIKQSMLHGSSQTLGGTVRVTRLILVHGQVTIIFVVSVCLFVQSFSQPSLIRFWSIWDTRYMSGSSCVP